jgi:hypothetical protein
MIVHLYFSKVQLYSFKVRGISNSTAVHAPKYDCTLKKSRCTSKKYRCTRARPGGWRKVHVYFSMRKPVLFKSTMGRKRISGGAEAADCGVRFALVEPASRAV